MQVELKIVYDTATKDVGVNGPNGADGLVDVGLCHLMLDLARQVLLQSTMQKASERRIALPGNGAIPFPPRPS